MRDDIDVFVPRAFSWLMFGCSALLALVPAGFALAGELPPLGFAAFACLIAPFVIAGARWPRFHVWVRQGAVTVRPCWGSTWSFAIADITKVVRRVDPRSETGELAKMTVWAAGRRVSVETLMCGSEAFWTYIEHNVSADRIVTKRWKTGAGQGAAR